RRLVHRRLREGEVLDAAGLRHRPPRMGRAGVRLRVVRRPAPQQGQADPPPGGDLPEAHRRRVAGGPVRRVDPLRADQQRRAGHERGAHQGPRASGEDRAPAVRDGGAARLAGPGRLRAARVPPRAAAQRGLRPGRPRDRGVRRRHGGGAAGGRSVRRRAVRGRRARRHRAGGGVAMIARELAGWALGLTEVPEPVSAAATRHLLDGFGTALGALRAGTADPAIEVARGLGGPAEAAVLGTGETLSAPAAALANGTLVHALDFDDTHAGGLVHATAVVLPAAFAVGQQTGASGREILLAAVVGYETACRVAAAAPHGFHARGLHATMVAGVFSSALITARLLGLDAERAANALGIAGSQAGGLLAFLGTGASTKQLHPGFASQSGIIATRLAAAGATGPETVFDGPHSVFDALSANPADPAAIAPGLGERWETTRIGIKPYAACQLSHATIGAVLDAMKHHPFGPEDVASVHAVVHPDSAPVVCDTSRDLTRPASPYAAKFSLPWTVA